MKTACWVAAMVAGLALWAVFNAGWAGFWIGVLALAMVGMGKWLKVSRQRDEKTYLDIQ